MQAYAGLFVLDLSQGIAGPVAAALLARQGAMVVKIEPPRGDWIRHAGASREAMSANAIAGNLNKRSLAVDATTPAGRAVVLQLAQRADVVIENFRPGVMKKLGLDYATMAEANPKLIYCSISGFGTSGPWVGKPGTDSVLQAYTGMAAMNGTAGVPRRVGLFVPDNATALYAAQAISAALYTRATTEAGQHIEISLAECCAALQAAPMTDALLFSDPAAKLPVFAPAGEFATGDGWIVVACLDDAMFGRLAQSLGHDEWADDARYAANDIRKTRLPEVNAMVGAALCTNTSAHWLAQLEQADVLCSAINDYANLRAHPQMQHMGYFATIEQPPYGPLSVPHLPAGERHISAAPRIGEHSRTVLAEFGYEPAQIDALIAQGVVLQGVH